MGFFEKILGKKHKTLPASGEQTVRVDENPTIPPAAETVRNLPRPEENKYNPAERVNMSREEVAKQIDEMAKTDKEKANALRKRMGLPDK